MRLWSHHVNDTAGQYREVLSSPLAQVVFILVLGMALSLVITSGNISAAAAVIFGIIFIWVAFTHLKAGIFLAIIFTNFPHFLEQFCFLWSAGVLSAGASSGETSTNLQVSLAIVMLGAFYLGKKVVARERILEYSTDKYVVFYLGWCLLETVNPNQSALVGIYGFKQELVPLLMFFLRPGVF